MRITGGATPDNDIDIHTDIKAVADTSMLTLTPIIKPLSKYTLIIYINVTGDSNTSINIKQTPVGPTHADANANFDILTPTALILTQMLTPLLMLTLADTGAEDDDIHHDANSMHTLTSMMSRLLVESPVLILTLMLTLMLILTLMMILILILTLMLTQILTLTLILMLILTLILILMFILTLMLTWKPILTI